MRAEALTWSYFMPYNGAIKAHTQNPFATAMGTGGESSAVLPGEKASAETMGRASDLAVLLSLITRFCSDGFSLEADSATKITSLTAVTASAFFSALPISKRLPKVAPDGEGGLMAIWEKSSGPLLVTIDDSRLHAVVGATTDNAKYLNDVAFDLFAIPGEILSEIPSR